MQGKTKTRILTSVDKLFHFRIALKKKITYRIKIFSPIINPINNFW